MINPAFQPISSRLGIYGAIITIGAIVFSGPAGVLLVALTHPQPPWQNAHVFVNNYHYVQSVPYYFGLFLVFGCVVIIAAVYEGAEAQQKPTAATALVFSAVFGALISFNYLIQTTYLPALVRHYRHELDSMIETLSMVNPVSLCWAVEMWGYAFLGLATWFAAPAFRRNRLERTTAMFFVLNGFISVVGAFITSLDLGWVVTPVGLFSYISWNVLMLVIAVLVLLSFRRRLKEETAVH